MRNIKSIAAFVAVSASLAGAGYLYPQSIPLWTTATSDRTKESNQATSPFAVEVQRAILEKEWTSKSAHSGVVKTKRRSELGFERGGKLESIRVERGDRVKQGETLASLNTDLLQVQLRKLQADRTAALAGLKEMIAGPRKEVIDAARSTVEELDVQIQLAKTKLERRKKLVNSQALAVEDLDQSVAEVKRYEAARNTAQKNLEDLLLGTRSEKIDNQRALVQSLDESIASVLVELDHSLLKSPFDGRIVERHMDEGFVVSAGTPAFVLIEDSALQAHFGLPLTYRNDLVPGQPMRILIGNRVTPAVLKSIVPQISDETRTLQVICTLFPDATTHAVDATSTSTNEPIHANVDDVLPGEIARLELDHRESSQGIWLKTSSVLKGPRGLWECFVVEPTEESGLGIVRRRAIEIQHTVGDRVLVRGALRENELVVASAVSRLVVGQKVAFQLPEQP